MAVGEGHLTTLYTFRRRIRPGLRVGGVGRARGTQDGGLYGVVLRVFDPNRASRRKEGRPFVEVRRGVWHPFGEVRTYTSTARTVQLVKTSSENCRCVLIGTRLIRRVLVARNEMF